MTLPHTFSPGTIASSSEVNANFNHLGGIIGSDSTSDEMRPGGDIVIGPQDQVQITAKGSNVSTYGNGNYFQLGWNASLQDINSTQVNNRVVSNMGATALTLSERGMSVKSTARGDGTLDEHMSTAMTVRPYYSNGLSTNWIYLNPEWKLQWRDNYNAAVGDNNSSHDNIRTTLVFLDPDIAIVGTRTNDLSDADYMSAGSTWGKEESETTTGRTMDPVALAGGRIPANPVGLLLSVQAKWIKSGTDANQHCLRIFSSDGGDASANRSGFTVTSNYNYDKNNIRTCYAERQGIVRLGSNSNGRKLTMRTSKTFAYQTGQSDSGSDAQWYVTIIVQGVFI